MTAYAVLTDLTTFGLMSSTLSTLDNSTQQAHLDAACDLADSYLGSKFKLPLTAWGKALTQKVCELAAYTAVSIRGFDPEDPGDKTIYIRGQAAIAWFTGITEGDITPVVTDSSGTPGQFGGPNTLQMSVQGTTPMTSGDTQINVDNSSPSVIVGRPRQRGW